MAIKIKMNKWVQMKKVKKWVLQQIKVKVQRPNSSNKETCQLVMCTIADHNV